MRKKKPEDTLEEYLNEQTIPDDPELAALARAADRLERGLNVEAPDAYRERALFIQGVAARKPGFPWARLMVPVMAASMFVAFVAISRDARPGDALYGFRKTLNTVGLAEDTEETAADLLAEAETRVEQGEDLLDKGDLAGARQAADDAISLASDAQELLEDASGEAQAEGRDRAFDVKDDARDLYTEIKEENIELRQEEAEEAAEESGADHEIGDDDNSGSGSGGSGGDDDNSGSGSDGSGGDDNSGSGSDDSGGDDNSGSGSDDSSGSGSGSDDSSGSGSGSGDSSGSGSGSGSDDSSGSGSGSDDN